MASWVTDERGLWHPAKERVSLKNYSKTTLKIKRVTPEGMEFTETVEPNQDYIYEGPCRQALFELWELDKTGEKTTLGEDFQRNPEFLESYAKARTAMGFNSVEEYLTYIGYKPAKAREEFEKKAARVKAHELPNRVNEIKRLGGGKDFAGGGNDRYGGFGEVPK